MSLATAASPAKHHASPASPLKQSGIIVIEARAASPLGPKVVFANEETSRLSGYQLSSLIGSPLGLIYDHQDLSRLIEKLPLIASSPNYCWMERNLICNGGKRLPVKWTIRPTQSREGNSGHFTLTISPVKLESIDSNLSKDTEIDIEGDDHIEESRSESLALAAGGVAHDFKNALQSIKTNLELAQRASRSPGALDEYLADASIALGDAETLAHQMLAFTKGEESGGCVFSVIDSVKRVSHLCTAGSGVRCRMRIDPGARPVDGDPNQIYQVLHNLVINACQAMPNGGTLDLMVANIDFNKSPNQFSVKEGRYTIISVRDRGCGISSESLPRIFDRTFTTKANGNGFGLASCRAIVKKHGGEIRAASKPGVGTEFLVFLPSAPEGSEIFQPIEKPDITETISKSKAIENLKVLVVEDQQGVAKATCRMLEFLGHCPIVAETGEKAIQNYLQLLNGEDPIDLVLLDMTLPGGLDGHDVLSELRKIDPRVIVIATSGYFEESPAETIAESGFDGILAKPYAMDSLAITLSQAASSR
ncbi:MAG: ATP-binding protein [Verrucomicrobiales bacterium]|nr:ATP-binding protein [Verrucomicrobiales bacterium]